MSDWQRTDRMDPARAEGLLALLDQTRPVATGSVLPPLAHLVYFWDIAAEKETTTLDVSIKMVLQFNALLFPLHLYRQNTELFRLLWYNF